MSDTKHLDAHDVQASSVHACTLLKGNEQLYLPSKGVQP